MHIKEFRLKLYPKNFQNVKAFYQESLGLPIVKEWDRGEDDQGVMFAAGNAILELLTPEEEYTAIKGADISLEVENVEELWSSLKDTSTVSHDLRHNSWGDTSFSIKDPEGFRITFFTKD